MDIFILMWCLYIEEPATVFVTEGQISSTLENKITTSMTVQWDVSID